MASDSSSVEEGSSQGVIGIGKLELGEFEIVEIDGVVLKDLLEDLEKEMTEEDGTENHHFESGDDVGGMIVEYCKKDYCLEMEQSKSSSSSSPIHDFDWLGMMEIETPSYPGTDMVWYPDDMVGMVDFDCHGDYLQFYNGILWEETSYGSLWHDI